MGDVSTQSSQPPRGKGSSWGLFLAPAIACGVVILGGILTYLGSSSGSDAEEDTSLESGAGDSAADRGENFREGAEADHVVEPAARAKRKMGDPRRGNGPLERQPVSRSTREESSDSARSDSSEEVDWELEMADSEEVELTPEAIEAARERRRSQGFRFGIFGPPVDDSVRNDLRARLELRKAERARLEGSEPPSGDAQRGPSGSAGAGPG